MKLEPNCDVDTMAKKNMFSFVLHFAACGGTALGHSHALGEVPRPPPPPPRHKTTNSLSLSLCYLRSCFSRGSALPADGFPKALGVSMSRRPMQFRCAPCIGAASALAHPMAHDTSIDWNHLDKQHLSYMGVDLESRSWALVGTQNKQENCQIEALQRVS